jgi:hypothetical protein
VRVVGQFDMQPHEFLTKTLLSVLNEFLLRKSLFRKANFTEDEMGDFVVSFLKMQLRSPWVLKPLFSVLDQSRRGVSESGQGVGEIDGIIQFGSQDVALIEALRLSSVDTSEITIHVKKAVEKYNPTAISCIYILVYFEGMEWKTFWGKYQNHVKSIAFSNYEFDPNSNDPEEPNHGLAWVCHNYKPKTLGERLRIYHIAVNLN